MSSKSYLLLSAAAALALPAIAFADKGLSNPRSGIWRTNPANAAVGNHVNAPASPAEASHTFTIFNQTVTNPAGGGFDGIAAVQLTGLPAGIYTGYSVSVNWSAISGNPWSNEAIWALTDTGDLNTVSVFYADPGPAPNSAGDGNPVTLNWSGFLDTSINAANPLYMLMGQTFDGSSAQWDSVTVTLNDSTATPPTATPTYLGGSLSSPQSTSQVQWFSFDYSGSGALHFDTNGSSLSGGSFPNDTEIGLYSSSGALIATNDDIDFGGGIYTSALDFFDGELAAGTYYLAAGGFNMEFGPAFGVTSDSLHSGTLVINGLSIPEPASLGLIGLAGGALVGRRRRH